jgi:hypothetical protein
MEAPAYRRIPVEVEARHFEGGVTSASNLIEWLITCGWTARWNQQQDIWVDAEGKLAKAATPETLIMSSPLDENNNLLDIELAIGDWVTKESSGLKVYTDEEFKELFEEVGEGPQNPDEVDVPTLPSTPYDDQTFDDANFV